MLTIRDFEEAINEIAPPELAWERDNIGLLVGSSSDAVTKVLLALDATNAVVNEAKLLGANLIITHHPTIFTPLKTLDSDSIVYKLASSGIGLISAHTNLDVTDGGVNSVLAETAKLKNIRKLNEQTSAVLIGELDNIMSTKEFAQELKKSLGAKGIMLTMPDKLIKTVALCSGSGGSELANVVNSKADVYVTGELSHDKIIDAQNNKLSIILGGHFHTETIVMEPLRNKILKKIPNSEIFVSKDCTDGIEFI